MTEHQAHQRVLEGLERLKRRTYRSPTPNIYGQGYQYVFGFTKEGKKVIWGPYSDPREADRDLAVLEDGEVFDLDTKDIARATREIKSILLKRGEDPDEVLRRALHNKEV